MHRSWPPSGRRAPTAIALTAVLSLSISGCGGFGRLERASDMVGSGIPQLHAGEHVDGESTDFEGVVDVTSNGCKRVRVTTPVGDATARWAVWPEGVELVPEVDGVRLSDQTFVNEDRVSGTGRLVDLAALPLGQEPGSYFASTGGYCDAESLGVLVIDEIRHA